MDETYTAIMNHGRIIDEEWQHGDRFTNILDSICIRGKSQEITWFRVVKLISVKRLIEKYPFNFHLCLDLNKLKVLE